MRIDLGCGSMPRGDINITNGDSKKSLILDKYLKDYGFEYNPDAKIINSSIEDYLENNVINKSDTVLMSHIIEHIYDLNSVMEKVINAEDVIIITPNSQFNNADWYDDTHIRSFTIPSLRNYLINWFNTLEIYPINYGIDILAVGSYTNSIFHYSATFYYRHIEHSHNLIKLSKFYYRKFIMKKLDNKSGNLI